MRSLSAIALSSALAILCACGGGAGLAGGQGATLQGATVQGKITRVDGSRADLAGIVIESRADGTTVVTGADGLFQLRVRAGEPILLRFEDPDHPEGDGGRDTPEDKDVSPDGADIDGPEIELEPLHDGERCEIEVEIEHGEVAECRVEFPDREDEGHDGPRIEAECRLHAFENGSEPESAAEAELVCEADCCVLEVEVAHVFASATLTVAIECEERTEEIGTIEIVDGTGHFEIDSCEVDVLPFDVESVYDLRGCTLLLLDEDGEVALFGCVPGERDDEQRDEEERHEFVEDCRLEPVDGSSEPEAEGGSVVRCGAAACSLVVEVGGVRHAESLTLVLVCEGEEVELGTLEIVEGHGRFAKEYGGDAPRPFGVESLGALAGCHLQLLDPAGEVALTGCFPARAEHAAD